ncbi:MAG: bifunctional nuclease family protein [Bdellovibrionales bacterium]|nr:bifunctional nuclease family protein [Bdellovibrionales bacterium]
MEHDSAIEMFVGGLVLDPNTQAPVVVLKDESGEVHLPIWIGVAEATSIASAIKEVQMARPLTHDLMMEVIAESGFRVERIVITELRESTYFAELILTQGDKAVIFDSRPSDAIALALRASAPIFVSEDVLKQAQITFQQQQSGEDKQSVGGENVPVSDSEVENAQASNPAAADATTADAPQPEEADPLIKNFKNIDKEKWSEMLAELDPDDFKYKT